MDERETDWEAPLTDASPLMDVTVVGPAHHQSFELGERVGEDYEHFGMLNREQAEDLLAELAKTLGYTIKKES